MLSSRSDRSEEKTSSRLDVLAQRVDTLASTVATTASAMAKRDGEIAALRKELDARDERLAAFVAQARETSGSAELRELKQAVAALASERSRGGGSTRGLDELTAKVTLLGQRLETLSATVSTTAAGLAGREGELAAIRKRLESAGVPGATVATADPALALRVRDLTADVTTTRVQLQDLTESVDALKALMEQHAAEAVRPSMEIRAMIAALRAKMDDLAELRASVTEEQLDERVARTDEGVARLTSRVDALAATIDTTVAGITAKEKELAEIHRQYTASSGRIEAVAEDIRDALAAFPEPGTTAVDDLAARLDRLSERLERSEAASRRHSETAERLASELSRKIEAIEAQVATVATEVARAKTLWPVALRSLEARLDDVVSHAQAEAQRDAEVGEAESSITDDDLLAGLRDSLQAMETVAAEMARASDVLSPADEPGPPPASVQEAVAAGGATIVPLRSSDP